LEFIGKKYFGRTFQIPELEWYTDLTLPLDPHREGPHPWLTDEADEAHSRTAKIEQAFSAFSLVDNADSPLRAGRKRVPARRISVSSSESDDVDIREVLEGVVREYTATHARSTRPEVDGKKGRKRGF
jgi:hypothetical protein